MNNKQYKIRLKELLTVLYQNTKEHKKRTESPKIEGFIEAGLCSGILSRSEVEEIINLAHKDVFGFEFIDKIRPNDKDSELLDIPTYIRDRKEI